MYYVTIFLNICYNIKVVLFFQLPNSDINEYFGIIERETQSIMSYLLFYIFITKRGYNNGTAKVSGQSW